MTHTAIAFVSGCWAGALVAIFTLALLHAGTWRPH